MLRARLRIRVEWSHCDPAKIIYNPHYYIWMDHGSHSLLRVAGQRMKDHIDDPDFKACPLVTSTAEFHAPAFLEDELTLTSEVTRFGTKSFDVTHRFQRSDTLVCTGKEVRVWGGTDENGNLIALKVPDWIRENLSEDGTEDVSV